MRAFRRRDALSGLAAYSLSLLTACQSATGARPPAVGPAATGIDVHCHVFNARDIPIVGFVTEVVLQGTSVAPNLAKPLVVLLALIMDLCSWSAEREANAIANGGRVATLPNTKEQLDSAVKDLAKGAIETFQSRSGRYQEFSGLAEQYLNDSNNRAALLPGENQDSALLRFLIARANPAAARDRALQTDRASTARMAAEGITAISDEVRGTFDLAYFLTRRRLELVQTLATLSSSAPDNDSIALYCPAMVDYSYWLKEAVTPLSAQVSVMTNIAAIKNRTYAVHPWISFCPWRQLREPTQLTIVQDAVLKKGFVGVKLYPVMGFRPYGNRNAPDANQYPAALRAIPNWDAKLDQALADLYDWCISEDVPIMAHCSDSQYPSEEAGRRGAPQEWEKVFAQSAWKNIRVNLGHLGGIWDLPKPNNNGWVRDAIMLLRKYSNVYADVADDADAMELSCGGGCPGVTEATALGALLDQGPDPGMHYDPRKKLMYGTDWVMLSRALHTDQYIEGLKNNLANPTRIAISDFLGLNAARFLGIDRAAEAGGRTSQRLQSFYKASGLPTDFLGRWQH